MEQKTTTQLVDQPEARRALMTRVQSAIFALRRGELVRIVAEDGVYFCLSSEQINPTKNPISTTRLAAAAP